MKDKGKLINGRKVKALEKTGQADQWREDQADDREPSDDSYSYVDYEDGREYEECEDQFEYRPKRHSLFIRVAALVTALAFLGLVLMTAWPDHRLPSLDLIWRSLQLKKEINNSLVQAVVQIDVVSRRKGSLLSVEQKTGTGFNVDPSGLIITNHHVVDSALNMTVKFPNGKVFRAASWSSKPESDLAVICLEAVGLPVVPVDSTRLPAPGDQIRVIGNPLSIERIMVEGKVGHYLGIRDMTAKVFSIDAPIYPGNSGSPVFNDEGKVVGVVFGSINEPEGGEENAAGLAVSINEVAELLENAITGRST